MSAGKKSTIGMKKKARQATPKEDRPAASEVRIVGGKFRGRKLIIPTDVRTRPMKNRVREAIFNLIGTEVVGKHAVDLFAGTGALGIEALSRGATGATFIERHFPTARRIEENLRALAVEAGCEVVGSDTFYWSRQQPTPSESAWVVFCSPPYEFYVSRADDMLALIGDWLSRAPAGSLAVVEADERFDMQLLPQPDQWDLRSYPPAEVAIWRSAPRRGPSEG